MEMFNISFELMCENCKGNLFDSCSHPNNPQRLAFNSRHQGLCPIIIDSKKQHALRNISENLHEAVKTLNVPQLPEQ